MREIYADHAATTKMKKEVLESMMPYLTEKFGNPSTMYKYGIENKKAIEEARKQVARAIGAEEESEICFTSGGSEADNLALKGIAKSRKNRGKHIITTKIEHMAILNTCKALEEDGFEITYINVDSDGIIKTSELERAIRPDTILISVMFANNEIGSIEPIGEISKIAKKHGILFHVDAVQAVRKCKNKCSKIRYRFNVNVWSQILWTKRNWCIICKKWHRDRTINIWWSSRKWKKSRNRKCTCDNWNGKSNRNCYTKYR